MMNKEYTVETKSGIVWVYAEDYRMEGNTAYFLRGTTIVYTANDVISIKEKGHV